MTYVVHGATGAQGKPVLTALKSAGKTAVAVGRQGDVSHAPGKVASYDSATQLVDAYRGASGVFVHLPLGREEDRKRYADNILAALAEARPERVIISTSG